MGFPNAKRMLLRALLCAWPGIAPASFAESPNPSPHGIVSDTMIADLGPEPVLRREPVRAEPEIRGNPLWSIPVDSLSTTRDRPLFSPSRRPPPPAVVAAPYVPPPPPPPPPPSEPDHPLLTLLGIVASGNGGVGIFMRQSDQVWVNLRIGEGYQGWVLRTVRGREAIFEKSERTATLALPTPPRLVDGGVVTAKGPAAASANGAPTGFGGATLPPGFAGAVPGIASPPAGFAGAPPGFPGAPPGVAGAPSGFARAPTPKEPDFKF
jgi:general secretion pathway protein N